MGARVGEDWEGANGGLRRWLGHARQRIGRYLPRIFEVAMAVALAYLAAKLVWVLLPGFEQDWKPAPVTPVRPAPSDRVDLEAIVAAHLFGQYKRPERRDQGDPPPVEAPLNVTVMGIFSFGQHTGPSRVLIAENTERSFGVGDEISSGVAVLAIYPDRVEISNHGRTETLLLNPDQRTQDQAGLKVAAVNDGANESEPPPAPRLGKVREELTKNPADTQAYFRLQPNYVGGHVRGYRLFPGRDRALFMTTGLVPGDVVVSFNGVSLNDAAGAQQLAGLFGKSQNVSLVVDRGDSRETIKLDLK